MHPITVEPVMTLIADSGWQRQQLGFGMGSAAHVTVRYKHDQQRLSTSECISGMSTLEVSDVT